MGPIDLGLSEGRSSWWDHRAEQSTQYYKVLACLAKLLLQNGGSHSDRLSHEDKGISFTSPPEC